MAKSDSSHCTKPLHLDPFMLYWSSRYIILSVMLFAGNKICHPDLALGHSEWIFGRYEVSLKTVAASLSFTVW